MASVVAQSYSDALYSLGEDTQAIDVYKKDLLFVNEQIQMNRDFAALLTHPKLHKEDKKQMLDDVFAKAIDHTVMNFLKLLIDKSRVQNIDDITKAYVKRYNIAHGIEVAIVKSAQALSDDECVRIKQMLETKLQKKIEMRYFIDPDLIAGIRVKIGDVVLDYTAKNRIEQLKGLAKETDFKMNRGECK